MVGATAKSAVAVRGLAAPPTVAAADAAGPGGPAGAAGWALAKTRAGLASSGVALGAEDTDAAGLSGAPGRKGRAMGGTPGLPGMPGTGPPVHIRVLAGEAGLLPPRPPPAGAAAKMGLPQAWQKLRGCDVPGLRAGSGAWQ